MLYDEIRKLSLDEIRELYIGYLKKEGFALSTITVAKSDAFYLLNHDAETDFWELLQADDFEQRASLRMRAVLSEKSKGNVEKNISGYMAHLRRFRKFVFSDSEQFKDAQDRKKDKQIRTKKGGRKVGRKVARPEIPRPTEEAVKLYQREWDAEEEYREKETALRYLFKSVAPENKNITDILLKVTTLNQFYSTYIFSVYSVAKKILALDIDERIKAGDLSLVEEIKSVTVKGKEKHFYSFASKYCSHHNPEQFPIYDSYVDKVLRYFRDVDGFSSFTADELKDYVRFSGVISAFRQYYHLEKFTIKEIDKYLWQIGKKYF